MHHRRALELWQKRPSATGELLPDIFSSPDIVTSVPLTIVGRNKLVLKAKNVVELVITRPTKNEEFERNLWDV